MPDEQRRKWPLIIFGVIGLVAIGLVYNFAFATHKKCSRCGKDIGWMGSETLCEECVRKHVLHNAP